MWKVCIYVKLLLWSVFQIFCVFFIMAEHGQDQTSQYNNSIHHHHPHHLWHCCDWLCGCSFSGPGPSPAHWSCYCYFCVGWVFHLHEQWTSLVWHPSLSWLRAQDSPGCYAEHAADLNTEAQQVPNFSPGMASPDVTYPGIPRSSLDMNSLISVVFRMVGPAFGLFPESMQPQN